MRLLMCLAERAGEIVSIDELLDRVWSGVNVAPDSVYQAVASLRRDPRRRPETANLHRDRAAPRVPAGGASRAVGRFNRQA